MNNKVLVATSSLKQAVRDFRGRLEADAVERKSMDWTFPNGETGSFMTYTLLTTHGKIQVGLPIRWGSRIPHLIRRAPRSQGASGVISPEVELNIPEEHDRRVSGVYASIDGEKWLCSRGSFTSFRGRIPRAFAIPRFQADLKEVQDVDRAVEVIAVAALQAPDLADSLAAFTQRVADMKADFKRRAAAAVEAEARAR